MAGLPPASQFHERAPKSPCGRTNKTMQKKNEPDHFAVRAAEKHHAHRFGEAEQDAAGEAAEQRAETGQHDDDQRLERPLDADGWADRIGDADEPAGDARQRGAESESEQVGSALPESPSARSFPVLRGRANGPAPARLARNRCSAASSAKASSTGCSGADQGTANRPSRITAPA